MTEKCEMIKQRITGGNAQKSVLPKKIPKKGRM